MTGYVLINNTTSLVTNASRHQITGGLSYVLFEDQATGIDVVNAYGRNVYCDFSPGLDRLINTQTEKAITKKGFTSPGKHKHRKHWYKNLVFKQAKAAIKIHLPRPYAPCMTKCINTTVSGKLKHH